MTITSGITVTSSYGSWYVGELPIRADMDSVNQFCIENGYQSGGTYTQDLGGFSNDGGRLMNYYGLVSGVTSSEYHWINFYGYDGIVTSITET